MKRILIMAVLALSFSAHAQQVEPKFEKVGDKVKATYFHANGEISQQGFFLNEKLEGKWTMFDDKGEKIAMGNYDKGVKTGKWLFWEGDTVKEVNFDNNRIASVEKMDAKEAIVTN
ncbi:toxin-antitoxin system YwqK family antitoxin [Maribacter cobaltidurans]|uniref:Nicotinic acid mononucleotide adenyltransferase n=1 Tax=Maribacter cobaltidurans TaxID=1178778 RepID=A0A223VB52_9FLAO|nr:nicotinic acid mononucleotide adenyltransferase [Maribacter cobaltidurans]ASV32595.1 nicotinic acid mononucleotide adenyltransferase [Maribacter cobaltidurans]